MRNKWGVHLYIYKFISRHNQEHSVMNHIESTPIYHHAIVIGGSIAGMSVARVLTDHFEHVTIIERDAPPQPTLFRRGTPQARHPHILLKGGELALEQLFPGLRLLPESGTYRTHKRGLPLAQHGSIRSLCG
jgi:glycine/D-amino acid oxidase-like deaminating enzyme